MRISTVVRRIIEVVVLAVLFAGLQVLVTAGAASAAAAADPCSADRTEPRCWGHDYQAAEATENSSFNKEKVIGSASQLTKVSTLGVKRDLSGAFRTTRGRLAAECLSKESLSIAVYAWYLCGSGPARGVEAIAQARFIAAWSADLGPGHVSPDVQWEVSTTAGTADVVLYPVQAAYPAVSGPAEVVEVKQKDNGTEEGAQGQAIDYRNALSSTRGPSVLHVWAADAEPYVDRFKVLQRRGRQGLGETDSRCVDHEGMVATYEARGTIDGVLWVEEVDKERRCLDEEQTSEEYAQFLAAVPASRKVPSEVDVTVDSSGFTGTHKQLVEAMAERMPGEAGAGLRAHLDQLELPGRKIHLTSEQFELLVKFGRLLVREAMRRYDVNAIMAVQAANVVAEAELILRTNVYVTASVGGPAIRTSGAAAADGIASRMVVMEAEDVVAAARRAAARDAADGALRRYFARAGLGRFTAFAGRYVLAGIPIVGEVVLGAMLAYDAWKFAKDAGRVVSWGDPHLNTLDGRTYDLQTVGEFTLAKNKAGTFEIQGRYTPLPGRRVSVMDTLAVRTGANTVEVDVRGRLVIDGEVETMDQLEGRILDDGTIFFRKDSEYGLITEDDVHLLFDTRDATLSLADPGFSLDGGLLGVHDGDPNNDISLPDGTIYPLSATPAQIHGPFANAWRVTDESSLFTYGDGESTATFTDLTYPDNIVTISDFPAADIEIATDRCRQAGVVAGPQFNDCVYDILVTGDESWAQVAAAVTDDLVDPLAKGFVDGVLSEDFTAPVAENFATARYLNDPATSRVAGPFFDDAPYSFFVTEVGRHDQLTMKARLVAYGPVDSDASTQQVRVSVDGWELAPLALEGPGSTTTDGSTTFVRGGTTAQGQPFRIYDAQIVLQNYGDALKVKLTPVNFRGVLDTALGVNHVDLQLQTPPSDDFSLALPANVALNDPGVGAGSIETPGGEDNYTVNLAGASSDLGVFRTGGGEVRVSLVGADGIVVRPSASSGQFWQLNKTGQFWRFNGLESGTYVVRVRGAGGPAPYELAINTIPTDPNVAYRLGDPATTLTTVAAGQDAAVSFTATKGQRMQAQISGSTFAFSDLVWGLQRPDGSELHNIGPTRGDAFLDTFTLDQTGTWKMVFDPKATATGSVTFKGWAVPAQDAETAYQVGDPAVAITTTGAGQNAILTFSATQGQRVLADVSELSLSDDSYLTWNIQRPDGTWVASTYNPFINGAPVEVFDIDQSGTWKVVFDPTSTGFGSLKFQAWNVPTDVADAVTLDAPAATVTTTPGQNATLTFSATQGQRIAAETSASTYGDQGISWSIRRPDGSSLRPTWYPAWDNEFWDVFEVDQTGDWTVVLDPSESGAGSVRFRAWTVPADLESTYVFNDPATTVTTTAPGQNAWVSFPAISGQRVSLETSDAAYGAGDMTWSVIRPDGTVLRPWPDAQGNEFWDAFDVDQTGTWKVRIDPRGAAVGSVKVRGWTVPADVVTTVGVDDGATTIATTAPGQNARASFQATAGQSLKVETTNSSFGNGGLSWYLVKPNGTEVRPPSGAYVGDAVIDPLTINQTGAWTVVYDPSGASVGSLKLAVSTKPVALGALTPGVASTINGLRGGQVGAWTISGQAGQRIAVETTGSTFPSVSWKLLDPTGVSLAQGTGNNWTDVVSLPTTGTYRFLVAPGGTTTGSITAKTWTVTDAVSTLTLGGAKLTASVNVPGARAIARLTGTSGQRVSINLTNSTTSSTDWKLVAPSGSTLASGSGNGFVEPLALPAAGTYDVILDPPGRAIGALGIQAWSVPADVAAGALTMGTAKQIAISTPGQVAMATFAGTVGQRVAMQTTGSTYAGLDWNLVDPTGAVVAARTGNAFVDVVTLAKAGTYTVVIDPQKAATGTVSLTGWTVPADLAAGALTLGTAKTVAISNVAQNASATFTGTSGQRVALQTTGSTFAGVDWALVSPTGTTLGSGTGNGFQDVVVLPSAGTYKVTIDPTTAATGKVDIKVWTVPADVNAGALTKGGAAVTVTIATAGQNGFATYAGTAGQSVTFSTTGGTLTGVPWRVLRPDGTTLASGTGTSGTTGALTLPTSGNYRFLIDPVGAATGTATVKVT